MKAAGVMIRRSMMVFAVLGAVVTTATARPLRTVLVQEQRRPEVRAWEVGVIGTYDDEADYVVNGYVFGSAEVWTLEPYVRYGLTRNLAVNLTVPYVQVDAAWFGSEGGLGDVRIGADIKVYENTFGYPWIMPYVEVSLPTGDENKGLGAGETTGRVGVAVGTQMYDHLGVLLDGRYEIVRDQDNHWSLGGGIILDLSKQLSLLAEVRVDEKTDRKDSSVRFLGGMVYVPAEHWSVGVHLGAHKNGGDGTLGAVKIAYSLP